MGHAGSLLHGSASLSHFTSSKLTTCRCANVISERNLSLKKKVDLRRRIQKQKLMKGQDLQPFSRRRGGSFKFNALQGQKGVGGLKMSEKQKPTNTEICRGQ